MCGVVLRGHCLYVEITRWERGMDSRKKGYLRAQTESIREFTVKGLEPELNRLMEKHRGDIGKQTTRWDVTRRALRAGVDVELTTQQSRIWDAAREKHMTSELDGRKHLRRREVEMEREARRRYATALKEQADALSQLRVQLFEWRQKESLWYQHEQGKRRAVVEQRLKEMHARLVRERDMAMRLLFRGQAVVIKVRLADQIAWGEMAALVRDNTVADAVAEAASHLARRRDTTIDASICHIQKIAVVWEGKEAQAASTHRASLKAAHLIASAKIRALRAEWVDKYVAVLEMAGVLREQHCALLATEAAAQHHHHYVEIGATEPRNEVKSHAENLADSHLKQRRVKAATLDALDSSIAASLAAYDAATAGLQRIDACHRFALAQCREAHQRFLTSKDEDVKLEFKNHNRAAEETHDALDLEQVRHSHLGKLAASYRRLRP